MWTESERVNVLNVVHALEMEESDDRDEELFSRFGGVLLAADDDALLAAWYVDW